MSQQIISNKYKLVKHLVSTDTEIALKNISEINIRIKLGKRVYLFNRSTIIKAIEDNLSHREKAELLIALLKMEERNSDISHYLNTLLTGVIIRKESLYEAYSHAL